MPNARLPQFIVLLLLAVTWGSSFILMKRGMFDTSGGRVFLPNQVAAMRLTIAGLVLLPISLRAIPKIKNSDWKWLAVVGLVGSGAPAFLFTNSQSYLDSSVAGILNSLTPLFTLIIGLAIFRRPVSPSQTIGVLIGLSGAASLIALRGFGNSENWAYSLLIIVATFSYGLSVNTVQNKLAHIPSLQITALSLLIASIPCSIVVYNSEALEVLRENSQGWKSFGFVAMLAIGGTAIANMLYFWLTQQTNALFASSVTYIMPLVAVAWGFGDHEHINILQILCAAIILTGVWLVNQKKTVVKSDEK